MLKWRQIDRLRCAKRRTKTNRASLLASTAQSSRYSFRAGRSIPTVTEFTDSRPALPTAPCVGEGHGDHDVHGAAVAAILELDSDLSQKEASAEQSMPSPTGASHADWFWAPLRIAL